MSGPTVQFEEQLNVEPIAVQEPIVKFPDSPPAVNPLLRLTLPGFTPEVHVNEVNQGITITELTPEISGSYANTVESPKKQKNVKSIPSGRKGKKQQEDDNQEREKNIPRRRSTRSTTAAQQMQMKKIRGKKMTATADSPIQVEDDSPVQKVRSKKRHDPGINKRSRQQLEEENEEEDGKVNEMEEEEEDENDTDVQLEERNEEEEEDEDDSPVQEIRSKKRNDPAFNKRKREQLEEENEEQDEEEDETEEEDDSPIRERRSKKRHDPPIKKQEEEDN